MWRNVWGKLRQGLDWVSTPRDDGHHRHPNRMTAQYLRLSMFVAVTVLGVAIALAAVHDNGRFETSISDYYHTPAMPALVAVMFYVGISMICLYSTTPAENILLNVAGLFAPIVGFAATTQGAGRKPVELDVPTATIDSYAEVVLPALFIGLLVMAAFVAVVHPDSHSHRRLKALAAATFVALVWFVVVCVLNERDRHGLGAAGFFVPIIVLVGLKARQRGKGRARVIHAATAVVMITTALVFGWYRCFADNKPKYLVLVVEAILIAAFAIFWAAEYAIEHRRHDQKIVERTAERKALHASS